MDVIETVSGKFESTANGLLDRLTAQIDADDAEGVAGLAHKLKGMAANLPPATHRRIAKTDGG